MFSNKISFGGVFIKNILVESNDLDRYWCFVIGSTEVFVLKVTRWIISFAIYYTSLHTIV
jgi:hypothetical protein